MTMPNEDKATAPDDLTKVFAAAMTGTGKGKRSRKTAEMAKPFTPAEVSGVVKILEGLQMPLPQSEDEFMAGTEGCIFFMNHTATVVRIERKIPIRDVNDSQWVLKPLARFEVGEAVIEICPACAFEHDKERYLALKEALEKDGLKMWDAGLRQLGRIPMKTPEFPDGMTVVVDRGAVERLNNGVKPVRSVVQEAFYAPLRQKIASAYDGRNFDAGRVREFWMLCEEFVRDGKMVAGWNNYQPLYDDIWERRSAGGAKALQAAKKAAAYTARFRK